MINERDRCFLPYVLFLKAVEVTNTDDSVSDGYFSNHGGGMQPNSWTLGKLSR